MITEVIHAFLNFLIQNMTIAKEIITYWNTIVPPSSLPHEVEVLNPFHKNEVKDVVKQFYSTFFNDKNKRVFLIGINPGRLGSGSTGIGFTDSASLTNMNIEHSLSAQHELSAGYVYELIEAFGGPEEFYQSFYITAMCPLGFIQNGKNINYYDFENWQQLLQSYMISEMEKQLPFGKRDIAVCIGKGQNYKVLKQLNSERQWFDKVEVIPHPRWVMQYRRKNKKLYIDQAVGLFNAIAK